MKTWVHLTRVSRNEKTGPIPVSTTADDTCPPECPMREACYGKTGPIGIHWRAVSNRDRGMDWADFCLQIAALPRGQVWRHNQAGDLPGQGDSINTKELRALVRANRGRRGFTYSHKTENPENLALIREANVAGFTINLSANSLAHADRLAETKAGPVVCVLPENQKTNCATPAGRKVVICPATYRDGVSCATCQLCTRPDRSAIVGFPAHGTHKRKASAIAAFPMEGSNQ